MESGIGEFGAQHDVVVDLVPARITELRMTFFNPGAGCATGWTATYSPWLTLTRLNAIQARLRTDDPCAVGMREITYTLTFNTSTSGSFTDGFWYNGVFSVRRAP